LTPSSPWCPIESSAYNIKRLSNPPPEREGLIEFEDFRGISANDVLLDLDIPEAFHAMVSADVLIDSPTSFCFAAALNV
jgi:hypothetical protein